MLSGQKTQAAVLSRTRELFDQYRQKVFKDTDRLFAVLMILQWIGGIVTAVLISPRAWEGSAYRVHIHVWAALFLGGLITGLPVILALARPGRLLTRYVISVGQMLMSALLIHLTGGRIETHFHVFGSLAFLSFYRDWKVLVPATIVVAADHWIRGVYWPQSVYGVLTASPWRWLEHAGWVIFEDVFLFLACVRGTKETYNVALRTAELEATNRMIENRIRERTSELSKANEELTQEIDKRQRLEKVAAQAEKMAAVGQLAGGVAHEINNPLGVILGFAQALVRRLGPGDVMEMPLKSIEREAIRCKDLVQDLLTFSRTEKKQKEKIHVNQTIESAIALVRAQSKVKSVDFIKELAPDLPEILANANQIQRIVINLCNNAIDAMPDGGKLVLRTRKVSSNDGFSVEIQVQDTGQGIPPEIKSRIFEPFFTTKEVGKGTGLGLSLVYDIIQKHEGQIHVESEMGKGTIFSIHLKE